MQRTAILLAYLFICVNCFSQQYPFVHYTPKDGLVNSRVKKAYQDSKGRMYFLTYGGLSVFDGARFKNYTTQNGLATNIINDILEVGDDSLLVATNARSLNALVKGKITTIKVEADSCPLINQFYRHDDNKIYISSDDGLFLLENKKITALNISAFLNKSSELPYVGNISGSGNHLILTTDDMSSKKELFLYDITTNKICDALRENALLVGKDKRNRIWISKSHKLFILDIAALAKGKIILIPPAGGYRMAKDYSVTNLAFDSKSMWLVYRDENFINKEIRRIDESGAMIRISLPEQAVTLGIGHIMIDRENTIWLSSGGILKIVNSPLLIFEKPFNSKKQIDRAFYSNNVTWFNNYWFGDSSNKLFKSSQQGIEEFNCNLGKAPILFYADANSLLAYDFGNIYQADLRHQKKIIYFRKIISLPEPDFFVKRLLVDGNDVIIATQKSGLGVWKNKKLIFHLPILQNDIIEGFAFDKNNLLWVVKRYWGIEVFSLHPENSSNYLKPVLHFGNDQITGSPRSLVMDKNGVIWIGTRDDGLIGYKQEGSRLIKLYHFNNSNGLTDNFVTTLSCDSMNNIIAGTQTGLDRIVYDPKNPYRVENLSKSSNFFAYITQTWSDSTQAYALTSSGVLLQVSNPLQAKTKMNPQLLLEEMKVNAQVVVTGKKNFRYKENNISFFVAAPSFIDEKQVVYTYLLEGSGNKQWSDTSSATSVINLTNLAAGEYLLKVKAFFPSTTYPSSELTYSFEITPPWWQTWWFRSIAALLIIGLLIIAFRFYYRRKLEKQMAVLEKQQAIEKERTRIATDMHDDLGAGLSRIKFITQSISNKNIEDEVIKTELKKITGYSNEMTEKMGEIVWALNEKNDTLADLLAYTRSYAAEYLGNHNIQYEATTPLNLPGSFIPGEMRRNIFLSVKECLHNIVKHAEATKVCFSVVLDDAMQIVIHDNGKGIDWNNQRAFSNGIQNIKKRMKEINGQVTFSNEQGTKVIMTIPMSL